MGKWLQYLGLAILLVVFVPRLLGEFQDKGHSNNWPVTSGILADAYIKEVVNADSNGNVSGYLSRHFELVVDYSYQVDGQLYRGHRVRATEQQAKEALNALKSEATVPVYYDAKNPASSVLHPG